MAHKINPISFRIGIVLPWTSRWFFRKSLRVFLQEDVLIRDFIKSKILAAGIDAIEIERVGQQIKVNIRAARPGLIIGRAGKGIDDLRRLLMQKVNRLRKEKGLPINPLININIEELKRFEVSAKVIAQQIAFDIEKRMPYRGVMKRTLSNVMQYKEVQGAKIKIGGRLNGAEISREDSLSNGQMPLQTLRANIDYGEATSYNTYGTIGVKVWIYKGEIFDKE
ncbi:MAG: 30S ribosomal protein S3 [bacterium]|nr:30S ribosomal protein S3 [bacterium]